MSRSFAKASIELENAKQDLKESRKRVAGLKSSINSATIDSQSHIKSIQKHIDTLEYRMGGGQRQLAESLKADLRGQAKEIQQLQKKLKATS